MHMGNWSDLADEYIYNQEFSSVSSSNKREKFKIDQNGDREMDFEFLTFGTGFQIDNAVMALSTNQIRDHALGQLEKKLT